MATRKPKDDGASLPFSALQVLAPPVRLVSAALWKVLKQRDVMQYGVVEEFVTSACETVPGLLTVRHQGKLALGLRARLILELCSTQPDVKRKDVKIMRTVEHFHSFIHTLLSDPEKREQYFKKEFPVDYGSNFDKELEKLLWEFLIRLDQLLPVPNLAQTVSWLSNTPAVLEECARAATQPQLLKILLQHQTCLGHLESAASLPPNMGDSILTSLSLPLSGIVASNQQTGARQSAVDQSDDSQTRDKTSFIAPVIGLISNEDVPVMISANKRKLQSDEPASSKDSTNQENLKFSLTKEKEKAEDSGGKEEKSLTQSSGKKRKQPDSQESRSEQETDEEEVLSMARSGEKRTRRDRQGKADRRSNESEENGGHESTTEVMATDVTQLGVHLPEDPLLHSIFVSCLTRQPRVVIEKLLVASAGSSGSSRRETFSQSQKSPVKAPTPKRTSIRLTLASKPSALDNKENHPVSPSVSGSPSQQRSNTETLGLLGGSDDYVADSEDEATKNFKSRLFQKRYVKTKHGTFVPTLREYYKPGTMTRNSLSAGRKPR
ncbi:TERF1-interacting nuclear factor 2 isoform X2 [Acanthochromis polyacanthus]|uniref:TERF1-interacting nuclear factor 2 isoform X2 n=1 Tax=Acanthochromis polyacanthus TaxID=80966 RepID=UPI000B90A111|nr:TERF1-interacting nuclear factor 2 isoform X2 [Acanthochromis polyacanthus]